VKKFFMKKNGLVWTSGNISEQDWEARIDHSIQMPPRLGGLGLRSSAQSNVFAYYASLANASWLDKDLSHAAIPVTSGAPALIQQALALLTDRIGEVCRPPDPGDPPTGTRSVLHASHWPWSALSTRQARADGDFFEPDQLPSADQFFEHWHSAKPAFPTHSLQRLLSRTASDNQHFAFFKAAVERDDRTEQARLIAKQETGAGRCFFVIPTDELPSLLIADHHWRSNLCLHIGISPLTVPIEHCSHGLHTDSNFALKNDPHHYGCCNGLKRTAGLHGHDSICHLICNPHIKFTRQRNGNQIVRQMIIGSQISISIAKAN